MSFWEILINGTKCNRHGYNVDALLEEAPLLIASLAISLVVLGDSSQKALESPDV